MQQPNNPRQLRIEMPPNPSAVYSNTVIISHTQNEVVFDFIQIMPNDPRARIQQRIVMTPAHAKMFLNALMENIRRYEDAHGVLKLPPRPQSLAEELFKDIRPPDLENDANEGQDDEYE